MTAEPDDITLERPRRKRQRKQTAPAVDKLASVGATKLTRSNDDRMLGGVCGGLARYLGLDPSVVRIGFVLGVFVNGATALAYLAALLLVPAAGAARGQAEVLEPVAAPDPSGDREPRDERNFLWGMALCGLGGLLLLTRPPFSEWAVFQWLNWGVLWPVAMIGFGSWVLLRSETEPAPGEAPPDPGKRLLRSTSERMIAGVCGGLARRYRVDPSILRIGWVVLTLWSAGLGLLVYLALALIVPEDRGA